MVRFAVKYWPKHAVDAEVCKGEVLEEVTEYFSSGAAIGYGCSVYRPNHFRHFADINRDDTTATTLYFALFVCLLNSAKMLLYAGADVNESGTNGCALQAVSWCRHRDFAQILLDRGADVDA